MVRKKASGRTELLQLGGRSLLPVSGCRGDQKRPTMAEIPLTTPNIPTQSLLNQDPEP